MVDILIMLLLKICMKIKKIDFPFFLVNFPPIQTLSFYTKPFSTHKTSLKNTKLDKALRILHLLSPRKTPLPPNNRQNHLRIIQDSFRFTEQHVDHNNGDHDDVVNIVPPNMFDEMSKRLDLSESARVLSRALSSCAYANDLSHGIQLHCLAIKSGFLINVYIGTSLINLYSKCRKLGHAYKVFDEMPVRNVVSWTAIISGCAHDWQVDACLNLYYRMRNSGMIPNDYTYASVLSACTGFGALGQGRNMHCQTIRMGFESYLHISNALVSMYCKCGNLGDAFLIFENIQSKDIISWNSIIVGCSIHGLALQSLKLFEKMKHEKFKPDAITFLGVLSSCRHAGLLEKGKLYFNSMLENGVKPELDHYSCMVDLLGRAGLIDEARDFIKKMPINPNAVVWGSLLSSCRVRGEVWHGIFAAESRLLMEPECASTHVQLSNLYASVGCWDQAARLRKVMKDRGLKTNMGYSWIEIKNEVFQFRAEDKSNSSWIEIVDVVDILGDHMRSLGYVPKNNDLEFDVGIYNT